jgi:xanthine/CO dehydrogenase XdhC/CoxF family maturation factor
MRDVLPEIQRWRDQGKQVAVATLIKAVGSSPRPLGSKLAISSDGAMAGSVSGGCVEGAVLEEARDVFTTGKPKRLRYGISDEQAWSVGLTCGGEIEVLVERLI